MTMIEPRYVESACAAPHDTVIGVLCYTIEDGILFHARSPGLTVGIAEVATASVSCTLRLTVNIDDDLAEHWHNPGSVRARLATAAQRGHRYERLTFFCARD
jgi:hypothetical protein